jgi:hypothetical protein
MGDLCLRESRFLQVLGGRLGAVNVRLIPNSNQFQIVRRKDFPFRVLHFLGMAKAPLDFPAFINALAPNARMHFVALRFVPIIGE